MKPCEMCKNKKVGCSKFCTKYKNAYDLCVEIIRRIRERES